MTVLAGIVAEAAARFGERPALVVDGGPSITYGELHEASDAVAVSLAAEGLGRRELARAIEDDPDRAVLVVLEHQHDRPHEVRIEQHGRGNEQPTAQRGRR